MKIEAYYQDGSFEVFDTEAHFNGSGALGSYNCMTTYKIRGSRDIEKDGLWIRYSVYDVNESEQVEGRDLMCPRLHGGYDVQILDGGDMDNIAWVNIDGVKRIFRLRADGPLIDGFKFSTAVEMYQGDKDSYSLSQQAVEVYRALTGYDGKPLMERSDGEEDRAWRARCATSMGWDLETIEELIAAEEMAREESDDYEDGEPPVSDAGDGGFTWVGGATAAEAPTGPGEPFGSAGCDDEPDFG